VVYKQSLPLLGYFNSKGVSFASGIEYPLYKEVSWDMTIGEAVKVRILELCNQHGLTINKLCTISGVTQSTVNNIVSGRNNSATVATIQKLCDGLNITITEFFDSACFRDLEQEIR